MSVKKLADPKLVILGDGELRKELIKYCHDNNLGTYTIWDKTLEFNLKYDVYFLGYERKPYPFLKRATLYLMTSDWEGFPLALCEAIASEVPVLASDCFTGPREIISPDLNSSQPIQQSLIAAYGVLMPLANNHSLQTWTDTIITLLNDVVLRNQLAQNGKQRVAVFDREKISQQWLDLIEQTR